MEKFIKIFAWALLIITILVVTTALLYILFFDTPKQQTADNFCKNITQEYCTVECLPEEFGGGCPGRAAWQHEDCAACGYEVQYVWPDKLDIKK